MHDSDHIPDEIAPNEPTLDAPGALTLSEDFSSESNGPRVNLVEGSGPGLSGEMSGVVRSRLTIASLTLFAAFAVFFLWWSWGILTDGVDSPAHWWLYGAQAMVTAMLGAMGVSMCRTCPVHPRLLRLKEALIFGLPAAFLVLLQSFAMPQSAAEHGVIPPPSTPWVILIFTYALFIPNTWKRAAPIIGAMALAPVVTTIALWQLVDVCHTVLNTQDGFFTELVLIMTIAAVSAVIGVHTIGTLRIEAFKAKQLGQYNLRHLIGVGGMGEVYLAEHRLLKRPCAIKLIRPDKTGHPKTLARFEREVKASAKLSHWNSIEIFDYGHAEDGTFYYVMEYLPGMNLQEIVNRFGPLQPERVIHLLTQVCDALSEAHAKGMVHRDIKPANIFAAYRGGLYDVAKLLDFGLVKPLESNLEEASLTQEGSITGSPLYMSPEQSTGESEPDARSDIYALGGVAYFLLTGRPPFDHGQPIKVLLAHAREIPASLRDLQGDIPGDLEAVVMKCLEKNPADRYQSVLDVRDDLIDCEAAGHWTRRLAQQWWEANGTVDERNVAAEPAATAQA